MIRKLMLFIFMVLALAFSASAVNIYGNTAGTIALSGSHGTNISGTIYVENTGTADITANLTKTALADSNGNTIPSSAITFSEDSFTVANKTNKSITVSVNIPSQQYAGVYYGNITATANDSSNAKLSLNVTVNTDYNFDLPGTLTFDSLSLNSTNPKEFTIRNSGNLNLTDVIISTDAASKYNITFNQSATINLGTLAVGESETINVIGYVPKTDPTTNHSVGTVYARSSERNESFTIYFDVESKLRISDFDVYVDKESDVNLDDGDTIEDKAKPGSKVKFDFKLNNDFTDDEEINIEDIIVTITIEGADDGGDLEEETDEFDLEQDSNTRKELEFDIPLNVREDGYNIIIEAKGDDRNSVEHSAKLELTLNVDRKSHEVVINSYTLSPISVGCDRKSTLEVEIMNIGANDEDEARLTIKNSDLRIDIDEPNIKLNEDPDDDENTYEKKVSIELPEDLKAGNYQIETRAYYNNNILEDVKTAVLEVKDCPKEEITAEEAEEGGAAETTQPATTTITTTPTLTTQQPIATTTEASLIKNPVYLSALILGNIIVLGAIIGVIAKLVMIKR